MIHLFRIMRTGAGLLLAWMLSGCSDYGTARILGAEVECGRLGSPPVSIHYLQGYFTFGGDARYPLDLSLTPDTMSFTGQARIRDGEEEFTGLCGGRWDALGAMEGKCMLSGSSSVLDIDLGGSVGEKGGCGTWNNTAGQAGDWRLAVSGSALTAGETPYSCEIGDENCFCTSEGGVCDPGLACLFGLCVPHLIESGCEDDLDCPRHRYCRSGSCLLGCLDDSQCTLIAPVYVCDEHGRCGETTPDGDGEADGEVLVASCQSPESCQQDGYPDDCGNRDCYAYGFRYRCDSGGNCQDRGSPDLGPTDPPANADPYVGVWGLLLAVGLRTTDLPLVGTQDSVVVSYHLVQVSRTASGALILEGKFCSEADLIISNELEYMADTMTWTEIPDPYIRSVQTTDLSILDVPILTAGSEWTTDRHVDLRGVRLVDPLNSSLPTHEEAAAGDDRIWDQDKDGHPGMTKRLRGVFDLDTYIAERLSLKLMGRMESADRAAGTVEATYESVFIGSSGSTAIAGVAGVHPESRLTYFRMVRLGPNADCAALAFESMDSDSFICWSVLSDQTACPLAMD